MFDVFGFLKRLFNIDSVCIDNNIFRLHYKATVIILLTFSLVVGCVQYIGNPIECMIRGQAINHIDSYCWIYSTFIKPQRNTKDEGNESEKDAAEHLKYYQWAGFILSFQALCFYFPRFLWKWWEDGRVKMLVSDCRVVHKESKADCKKLLIDFYSDNIHTQNSYAVMFFLCEFFNFVNVTVQMYFMNSFVGGEFSTYGFDILRFATMEPQDRSDPMARLFPKFTKCSYYELGVSGLPVRYDYMCILSLNNVNEKMFVFLWFWFLIVAVLSGLNLVYHMAIAIMPRFRFLLFGVRSLLISQDEFKTITEKFQVGDWFVLYQLSKNISPLIFKEFVSDLAKSLKNDVNIIFT